MLLLVAGVFCVAGLLLRGIGLLKAFKDATALFCGFWLDEVVTAALNLSFPCRLFNSVLVLMPLSSGLVEGVEGGAAEGLRLKKSVIELSLSFLLEEVRLLCKQDINQT